MNADPAIDLNPIASAPHLALLFLVIAAALGWSAWMSTVKARTGPRVVVTICRILLVGALFLLALNPGRWVDHREETEQSWSLLVDRSLSMLTEDGSDGATRWREALELAEEALDAAENPAQAKVHTFDSRLDPVPDRSLSSLDPDGDATDLAASAEELLSLARNRTERHRGTIVLSDGRQTIETLDFERAAMRARAMEAPFYVVPLGGEVTPVDLSVRPTRRQFVAFADQECTVTAKVKSQGLGPIRPEVALLDMDGNEIGRSRVELSDPGEEEIRFTFPAPDPGVHLFELVGPEWPEERILPNNRAICTVTVLESATRIFMAEGSPFWDSKFLAQMIRGQKNMEIVSVFRLADDRFFRVETGDERPAPVSGDVFPSSSEDLREYDLIVIGKGAEYFLDAKRLALLSEYVRDHGGAVLFTRGKPYRSDFPGLEFLESVSWGEPIDRPLELSPTGTGEAAGLFGDLLPAAGDPVWNDLPPIRDSHRCLDIKPFTEILLEGRWTLDGRQRTVPLLMSRRIGSGMTVTLNGDGLWQWDFFPAEQGVEGQYEQFWGQLIQWTITFSEFLPGQNLSLHLDRSIVRPGELVRARIGYRGSGPAEGGDPRPVLALFRDDRMLRRLPAARPGNLASRWEAAFSLSEPGSYRVQALDESAEEKSGPSLPVTVLPAPGEREQPSADPDFLDEFAKLSGGHTISPNEIGEIVSQLTEPIEQVDRDKAVWEPAWDRWHFFAIVLFFAGMEWLTRRRTGLL